MGVVQRESIRSTIISYAGAALGFVNQFLIMGVLLTKEEVGLINVLILIGIMYAQFASLGTANVALRFFPFFRDKEKGHNGMLFGLSMIGLAGFLFFLILFYLFHDQVLYLFEGKSPLLAQYLDYAVPFALSWIFLTLFDSYLRSLYKTVFSFVTREIIKRLIVTVTVGLYAFEVLDMGQFVLLYMGLHCMLPIPLIIYTAMLGEFHIKPQWGRMWQRLFKHMLRYGLFTVMAYGSTMLMGYVDVIMLSSMVGEGDAGVYTISFYLTSLILIPWKSLSKITSAQVSEHWKKRDISALNKLYKQTSLINLIVGSFLFLGIWLNRENLYDIIQDDFAAGVSVLLFVGLGRLFDMFAGLNGYVLNLSKKYVYDFYIKLFMLGFGVLANYFLIKAYGLWGAAFATMLTLILMNSLRMFLVWRLFKLHPFSSRLLWVLGIAGITYTVSLIPQIMDNFWIDIPIRSTLITVIFVGLVLGLQISPDINAYLKQLLKKFKS
jgi:O-antigen/teichoic acid export membrane protein